MIKADKKFETTSINYAIWCVVKSNKWYKTIFLDKNLLPTTSRTDQSYELTFAFINGGVISEINLYNLGDKNLPINKVISVDGKVLKHFIKQDVTEISLNNKRKEIINGNYSLNLIKRFMVACAIYVTD